MGLIISSGQRCAPVGLLLLSSALLVASAGGTDSVDGAQEPTPTNNVSVSARNVDLPVGISYTDSCWLGSRETAPSALQVDLESVKVSLMNRWGGKTPHEWAVNVGGVATRLRPSENDRALVFHACPGSCDTAIIDLLERERIPATIFISGPWLEAHPDAVLRLAANPLFEIANHGLQHRPLSVTGRSAYGIHGTRNVREVVDEVEGNARAIQALIARKPDLFCPGAAHADEVAIEVVKALGYVPVGFTVNGDAGATASKAQIVASLNNAPPGSLVLLHVNRPQSSTAEALATALPSLKDKGIRFVKLSRCSFVE